MNQTRRRTLGFLLTGLVLAVGTPVYLAFTRGLEVYLIDPTLLLAQAFPYLLACAFWAPYRTPPATSIGLGLAIVLLVTAGLIYIPMLTGLFPMGGDMVALTFIGVDAVTTLAVLVVTAIAYALLYFHRQRTSR